MNPITITIVSLFTIIPLNIIFVDGTPLMGSMEQNVQYYYPGRGDWIPAVLGFNPTITLILFIVLVGGLVIALGRNIYNIFFKYNK